MHIWLLTVNKSQGGLQNLKFAVELEDDYVGIELGKDEASNPLWIIIIYMYTFLNIYIVS